MNLSKVVYMQQARQRYEDPLELGGLPLVSPPRDGWPAVEAALLRDLARRRAQRLTVGGLALAATVVLAVGIALRVPQDPVTSKPAEPLATAAVTVPADVRGAPTEVTLESLVGFSQQLESRLRRLRVESGDLPARDVVYQVEIEDLVVQVDAQLSRNPESLPLWSQRVGLLLDLERLYDHHLRRDYARMASL